MYFDTKSYQSYQSLKKIIPICYVTAITRAARNKLSKQTKLFFKTAIKTFETLAGIFSNFIKNSAVERHGFLFGFFIVNSKQIISLAANSQSAKLKESKDIKLIFRKENLSTVKYKAIKIQEKDKLLCALLCG